MRRDKILVGSNEPKFVESITVALSDKIDFLHISNWIEFENEIVSKNNSLYLTDLNLYDCFPSVVFNKLLDIYNEIPIIILLDNFSSLSLYQDRSHFIWEILPTHAADDQRFLSTIDATIMRFELWREHL